MQLPSAELSHESMASSLSMVQQSQFDGTKNSIIAVPLDRVADLHGGGHSALPAPVAWCCWCSDCLYSRHSTFLDLGSGISCPKKLFRRRHIFIEYMWVCACLVLLRLCSYSCTGCFVFVCTWWSVLLCVFVLPCWSNKRWWWFFSSFRRRLKNFLFQQSYPDIVI